MPKPIVAYYRVSTDRQGIRGLGIEAQQAAVEQYALVSNGNILAEYREAESGRKSDRPQLREALKHARRSGAVLMVAKLDRLSRNLAFLSALMESRVDFICCDNPNANRLTLHILAAVAEDEAVRISERTKAALAAYKRRGGVLGTQDPRCCLNRTGKGKEGQRKAADLSHQRATAADALVITRIRELRNQGLAFRAIATALNDGGSMTRNGCNWSARQVQRVLDRS
ncbi:MAG: recombinase family protein [Planctomycetes bacterium]|nr:recombinase family protein [Planctomycetota bacterium]